MPPAPSLPANSSQETLKRTAHACTREDFASFLQAAGQPPFRLDQILSWLHTRRAGSWDEMSNLPKNLRSQLAEHFILALPELVRRQGSSDTTQKFLWRLRDGALIESVLIPANPALYSDRSDRHTLCVSTQVGCAYGCRFCASGLDGWKRNLTPDEIVGQVVALERGRRDSEPVSPVAPSLLLAHKETPPSAASEADTNPLSEDLTLDRLPTAASPPTPVPSPSAGSKSPSRLVDNLVIMGMGEPLANYAHLLRALRILNAPWGGGIGARKITVSTSGLAPQIRQLAEEPEQFRLAISLHGATDAVRSQIMPINRKYPLAELTDACAYYLDKKGRMITFEYILLEGINDDLAQVKPLAQLARRLHAKVNLIPYNAVEGLPWKRPDDQRCATFAKALERLEVNTTLRLEKGHDIDAACGQLRLKTERDHATPPTTA